MKLVRLKPKSLVSELKSLPDWKVNTKSTELTRVFAFDHYVDGLVMIARICVHAEILNHHPKIQFEPTKLRIKLSTHSLKGISSLDIELAKRIDRLMHSQSRS